MANHDDSTFLDDSGDFVSAVMTSTQTPCSQETSYSLFDSRKRQLSGNPVEGGESQRKKTKASPSSSELGIGEVLREIRSLKQSFEDRLDRMEEKICQSVMATVSVQLQELKGEVKSEIDGLERRVKALESRKTDSRVDRSRNLVVLNLPETQSENTERKVQGLFKDGLKLTDVALDSVERKAARRAGDSGVVIVTCKDAAEKAKVMKAKHNLQNSRNYKNVYISHDKSLEQRTQEANLRTIVKSLGDRNLAVRGSRVVLNRPGSDRDTESVDSSPQRRNNTTTTTHTNGQSAARRGGSQQRGRGGNRGNRR